METLKREWSKLLGLFVIVLALMLLKMPVEFIIDTLLVSPVASTIKSTHLNDLIFIVFGAIIFVAAAIKCVRGYSFSITVVAAVLMIALVYSYYRFVDPHWIFFSFRFTERLPRFDIRYFDVLYLIVSLVLVCFIIQKIRSFRYAQDTELSRLTEDIPWQPERKDLFNRLPAAKRIAGFVKESTSRKSFAIGICGPWGEGKTSFMKMIRRELSNERNLIMIDFNPWYSRDPGKIVIDFFDLFQDHLGRFRFRFRQLMKKYAQSLVSKNDNSVVGFAKDIFRMHEDSTIAREFGEIDEVLRELGKKIIVFVDDIDRLDKREVVEVIKLIRNSANFHNIFFLVAFDREYVKRALNDINEHNVDQYLEKIFQLEITPPAFEGEILKDQLLTMLIKRFPSREDDIRASIYLPLKADIAETITFKGERKDFSITGSYIRNLRDVVRFVNLFSVNYSHVADEVLFREFFIVQLIRLRFPKVMDELLQFKSEYFSSRSVESTPQYVLTEKVLPTASLGDPELNANAAKLIKATLQILFPSKGKFDDLSIRSITNLHRYLGNVLFETEFTETEFRALLTESLGYKEEHIESIIKRGLAQDLVQKVRGLDKFQNKTEFMSLVYIWVKLINEGIDNNVEIFVLRLQEQQTVDLFSNPAEYNVFIRMLFDTRERLHLKRTLVARTLLRNYLYDNNYNFVLSKAELQEIVVNRLREHVQRSAAVDNEAFNYYYDSYSQIEQPSTRVIMLDEANQLFLDLIQKNPDAFLKYIVRPKYAPHDGKTYVFEPFIRQYFGSLPSFEKFLDGQGKNPIAKEALGFLNQHGDKVFDEFPSSTVPINLKIKKDGIEFVG